MYGADDDVVEKQATGLTSSARPGSAEAGTFRISKHKADDNLLSRMGLMSEEVEKGGTI